VSPQITIPTEDFAAGGAMIRLDIRVCEKMSLQIAPLIKTPGTDGTFVRRFLHMQNFVNSQCPALAKSFAAFSAFKRFLLAVYIPEIQEETFRFKSYA